MNKTKLINTLILEYPFLENTNVEFAKQFYSESSRAYNTYLVRSNLPSYEQFVAKATMMRKYSLLNERLVLNKLNNINFPCPKLLLPQHEPQSFLLLEYIIGVRASEKLTKKENVAEIFFNIGALTGKLHKIKVDHFGDLTKNIKVNWASHLQRNTTERLNGAKKIISASLYNKAGKLLKSFDKLMLSEGALPPVLIHRDIYSDNFIVRKTNEMVLIDYGMAIGGRPFYDLAKFYIFDLYRFPDYVNDFLTGYAKHVALPANFAELIKLYLLRELLGCINFFHQQKKQNYLKLVIQILGELVNKTGIITQLIINSKKIKPN